MDSCSSLNCSRTASRTVRSPPFARRVPRLVGRPSRVTGTNVATASRMASSSDIAKRAAAHLHPGQGVIGPIPLAALPRVLDSLSKPTGPWFATSDRLIAFPAICSLLATNRGDTREVAMQRCPVCDSLQIVISPWPSALV